MVTAEVEDSSSSSSPSEEIQADQQNNEEQSNSNDGEKSDDNDSDSNDVNMCINDTPLSNSIINHKNDEENEKNDEIRTKEIKKSVIKESPKKKERKQITGNQAQKSGIIYLSRVPPGLEPNALRSLLSPVGRIGRIWLRVEDNADKTNKTKQDENTPKNRRSTRNFQDGWVEFMKLRDAKRAVVLLNGNPMSAGKKRGRFSNDLWSMKLLPRFTWSDLDREVFGGSQRERILKVREEVENARREKSWVESRFALKNQIKKKRQRKSNGKLGSKRFAQTESIHSKDDYSDERKAKKAAERVDREVESGAGRQLDSSLLEKLFRS